MVAHARMDGAWIGSVDISINKAFTARVLDISTEDLAANAAPGNQFYGIHVSNHGRIMIFAGGVPLQQGARLWARSVSVGAPEIRTRPLRRRRGGALAITDIDKTLNRVDEVADSVISAGC